eukprot:m51a1_g11980 putative C-tail anchored protein (993) ;mRNA; r:856815-860869
MQLKLCLLALALLSGAAWAACGSCAEACTAVLNTEYSGMTTRQPISNPSCRMLGPNKRGHWYKLEGTGQRVVASLCDEDTSFDTVIAVFDNDCSANCSAFDDDGCGGKRSKVTFDTRKGRSYYIFVSGFGSDTGEFVLVLTPVETPKNTKCQDATVVRDLPYAALGDTTQSPALPRRCGPTNTTGAGLWYKLTGHGGHVKVHTCDEDMTLDTYIEVYTGGCAADGGALKCLTYNDDSCGVKSEVTFFAVPTADYWIFISGYGAQAKGKFVVQMEDMDPNENSRCVNAIPVNRMPFYHNGNTANALETYSTCQSKSRRGQWFRYHGMGQMIDAYTCGVDNTKVTFDNAIDVYTQCNDDGTVAQCTTWNDDFCGRNSAVRFLAQTHQDYWIFVSGFQDSTKGGNYTLTIEPSVNASNTNCWKSHNITQLPYSVSQDNWLVPASLHGCSAPRRADKGRWFQYYHGGAKSASITIDTCMPATTATTAVEVYGACDSTRCVQTSNSTCVTGQLVLTFTAEPRHTYFIFVYGKGERPQGMIHMEFREEDPIPHGKCEQAVEVATVPYGITGVTTGAVRTHSTCTGRKEVGQWFAVTGTGNKMVATTCSEETDFDTMIDVYTACQDNFTCFAHNDDYEGCGKKSRVIWQSFRRATYYVYVHGFQNTSGIFYLQVFDEKSPKNAYCTGARKITSLPFEAYGMTTYAEKSNGTCHEGWESKANWFMVDGTDHKITISTDFDDTDFETTVDVYSACYADRGRQCVAESHETGEDKGEVTFDAYKGATYFITVTNQMTALKPSGFFRLLALEGDTIRPKSENSMCTTAKEIVSWPVEFDAFTSFMNTSAGTCRPQPFRGAWFWFKGTDQKVQFTTNFLPTDFDTLIDVYEGCSENRGVNCVHESQQIPGAQADITFDAFKGTDYWVVVTSKPNATKADGFFHLRGTQLGPIWPPQPSDGGMTPGQKAGVAILVISLIVGAAGIGFAIVWWKRRTFRADYTVIS